MSVRLSLLMAAVASLLAGCAHAPFPQDVQMTSGEAISIKDEATPVHTVATDYAGSDMTGPPIYVRGGMDEAIVLSEHQAVAETDGPYLLDTADRLRIFVYGQPNLSRLYIVDRSRASGASLSSMDWF